MKKYTELWEVILHEITIPLGKYAVAYDYEKDTGIHATSIRLEKD